MSGRGRGGGRGGGRGKQQRHAKGNNRSSDRDHRRQKEEKWKATRGDEQGGKQQAGIWKDSELDNARFQAFYKAQRFVSDGEEWDQFLKTLRAPLPACFRIYSDYAFAEELSRELLGFVGEKIEVSAELSIPAVEQLAWYPNGCAYKLGTDKRNIRKMERLEGLHKWLIKHTESGNITRQEAVSMVPPLALDVHPHHKCLDMCAAPGSKTSQLLEIVNRSAHGPPDLQGLVVANDPDIDRAYMLVHQCRRINSPLLLITTHRGEKFPLVNNSPEPDGAAFFDRVLCDVPCSGDGTMRKNPMIWSKWSTASGFLLHPLQLQIAKRGVQLLKTGGLMVYSTCSMSPYEDEACVAELLRWAQGTLELVDAREFLPRFKCRPGLTTWHVLDDYNAIQQARNTKMDAKKAARMAKQAERAAAGGGEGTGGDEGAERGAEGAASAEGESVEKGDVADIMEADAKDEEAKEEADAQDMAVEPPGSVATRAPHPDPHLEACLAMGMDLYPDFASVPTPFLQNRIRPSCFPPTAEEAAWMHLERCLRCVPHDEDSGGFFVATLRKVAGPAGPGPTAAVGEVKEEEVDEAAAAAAAAAGEDSGPVAGAEEDEDAQASKKLKATDGEALTSSAAPASPRPSSSLGQGMVSYSVMDGAEFARLHDFYGLSPLITPDSMYIRKDIAASKHQKGAKPKEGTGKSVYYLPGPLRDLMAKCELKVSSFPPQLSPSLSLTLSLPHPLSRAPIPRFAQIVSAGMKVLERKHDDFRLLQEGIQALGPLMTKRIVDVTVQDYCNFLGASASENPASTSTCLIHSCSNLHPSILPSLRPSVPPGPTRGWPGELHDAIRRSRAGPHRHGGWRRGVCLPLQARGCPAGAAGRGRAGASAAAPARRGGRGALLRSLLPLQVPLAQHHVRQKGGGGHSTPARQPPRAAHQDCQHRGGVQEHK